MATFTGKLNSNEIFSALYNMIISQEVFADNIKGTDLVDQARVDGSMYGDTKIYYSTDVLSSSEWGNDAEAANLLKLHRPEAPKQQTIQLDTFRQIALTVDDYLSKRAWADEGAFSGFKSVMQGWIRDTKKVYDGTNFNAYLGTAEGASNKASIEVDGTDAQTIANGLADIVTEMTDYTRDFNDYGQLRRYSEDEIKIIFNSKFINKIKTVDLPVIFNNAGLQATFSKDVLPARYFGKVNTVDTKGDGVKVRSLTEQVINKNHYFAGDLIKTTDTAPKNTSYTEDDTIVCKIVTKLPPYMSAFEVGSSFYNAASLTETNYLTFGHNTLSYLEAYPLITVKTK